MYKSPQLDMYEIENYAKTTAKRANLGVRWFDRGEGTVSTDGKNVYLPRIDAGMTEAEAEDMLGFVAHEVGHTLYSDFDVLKNNAIRQDSFLGQIHNAVEDDGIDAINAREFLGDKAIRSASTYRAVERIVDRMGKKAAENGGTLPEGMRNMAVLNAWYTDASSDYYTGLGGLSGGFESILDEKGKELLEKLRSGDYYHQMKQLRQDETKGRTDKAYQLSKRIFEEVFEQDAAKEEEKNRQKNAADAAAGKGEPQEGEGEKGKAAGGKGKMGPVKDGKPHDEYTEFDYTPFAVDHHEEFKPGVRKHGSHIDYSKHKRAASHGYTPTPKDNTIVIDYVKGTSNYSGIQPRESGGRASYDAEVTDTSGFANQVRMLLQIRSRSKVQYGVKRGSIHPSNTYRAVLKNAPGYNERVFKRVIKADVLDTAVYWLVDISGSMSGEKFRQAMAASCKINQAIGNALHIPLEITGFTEHSCRNAMFEWRKFDTQLLSNEQLCARMAHSSNYMNQNCDGDSIVYAYSKLKARKEKRKLLIVASDGSPASSKGGDVYGFTKDVVKQIERDRTIDVYAIGIQDRNVAEIYQQYKCINQASELESALLSIIEKKII